jgi:hypothetical protein
MNGLAFAILFFLQSYNFFRFSFSKYQPTTAPLGEVSKNLYEVKRFFEILPSGQLHEALSGAECD